MAADLENVLVTQLEAVEGLPGRVFPLLDVRYQTGPLAVYAQTRDTADQIMDGLAGLMTTEFTVHALDNTYNSMKALGKRIVAQCRQLQGYKKNGLWIERVTVVQSAPDLQEVRVNLFRRTLTVSLEYQFYEGE